jgi:hypothetical protein
MHNYGNHYTKATGYKLFDSARGVLGQQQPSTTRR